MPDFYLPYNGTNRKQKEVYLPMNSANRKQKELHVGWNGSNRKIFQSGILLVPNPTATRGWFRNKNSGNDMSTFDPLQGTIISQNGSDVTIDLDFEYVTNSTSAYPVVRLAFDIPGTAGMWTSGMPLLSANGTFRYTNYIYQNGNFRVRDFNLDVRYPNNTVSKTIYNTSGIVSPEKSVTVNDNFNVSAGYSNVETLRLVFTISGSALTGSWDYKMQGRISFPVDALVWLSTGTTLLFN